jgi:PAS domain S-box-containing protein
LGVVELRRVLFGFKDAPVGGKPSFLAKQFMASETGQRAGEDAVCLFGDELAAVFSIEGHLIESETASSDFSGHDLASLDGRGFLDQVHVADRPSFLSCLSDAAHDGTSKTTEFRFQKASDGDCSYLWYEITCRAMEQSEGSTRIAALCRDIERFKQREERLAAISRSALDANEAKTRFLGTMSHQLRTPLNAIIGFSEMMTIPGVIATSEEQMLEYAGIINASGKHLLGLVDEVLDMSRLESGQYRLEPNECKISDLVQSALELVQHEAEAKDVRVSVREFDQGATFRVDWRAGRQLLANLLAQQIKAAPKKGRVRLVVSPGADEIGYAVSVDETDGPDVPLAGSLVEQMAKLLGGHLSRTPGAGGVRILNLMLPATGKAGTQADNIVPLSAQQTEERKKLEKTG